MKQSIIILLFSLFVTSCATNSRVEQDKHCEKGLTNFSGKCVVSEVANYATCIRDLGPTLGSRKNEKISSDVGYFSGKSKTAKELSEKLARIYAASDSSMYGVVKQCDVKFRWSLKKSESVTASKPVQVKEQLTKQEVIAKKAAMMKPIIFVIKLIRGQYSYPDGSAEIIQDGNKIEMFITLDDRDDGPHYEVKGKVVKNTIQGEWFSNIDKKGGFNFSGEISSSMRIIDLSKTDDPIGSGINQIRLVKR